MAKSQKKLLRILKNDYAVNSGVYSIIDPTIGMNMDATGTYRPVFTEGKSELTYQNLLKVDMMSDESPNEDTISRELFGRIDNIKHDPALGYYSDLYIGHILEDGYRLRGSSGGFTSWILAELFKQKKIDGVIHVHEVDPKKNQGILFKYVISRTLQDIKLGAKSRYYPMEMSEVLRLVKDTPGKYAIVGIPEFIMELRLLSKVDPIINERIKYMLGLVCGHQKTAKYSEALAWQHGINPGDLLSIDFRVKRPDSTAIDYLHSFTGLIKGKKVTFTKTHSELFAENWAAGFFKSKFSDFTDNAFNELADVVLGDAWLPEYNIDGMGNNIVIVRHPEIAKLIKSGVSNNVIKVDEVGKETIKESQLGLIHHIRDELPYRLWRKKLSGGWTPLRRTKPSSDLRYLRKRVQDIRFKMATKSHLVYEEAVMRDDWQYFENEMANMINRYYFLYKLIALQDEGFIRVLRQKLRIRTRIKSFIQPIRRRVRLRTRIKKLMRMIRDWYARQKLKQADGAIITLNGYFNYGNIIQRFALQEFLRQKGYTFVSYALEPLDVSGPEYDRYRYTAEFMKKRILRKPFNPNDNLSTYIVGSDQVWRNWSYTNITSELGYFFLDFLQNENVKRIAYAASFGQSYLKDALVDHEFVEYARPLVKKFDAISVRERSGIEIMKKTWNVAAQQVLDPTMLLTSHDYSKLIRKSSHALHPVKPIFTYILAVTDEKTNIIQKIVNDTNKKAEEFDLEELDILPPVEQWLKNFRDAELVITDSFHGAVFSIINNTSFIVVENSNGGVARITSLLEHFGLGDRLVLQHEAGAFDLTKLKPIDWQSVNEKMVYQRKQSAAWLLRAITQGES